MRTPPASGHAAASTAHRSTIVRVQWRPLLLAVPVLTRGCATPPRADARDG